MSLEKSLRQHGLKLLLVVGGVALGLGLFQLRSVTAAAEPQGTPAPSKP